MTSSGLLRVTLDLAFDTLEEIQRSEFWTRAWDIVDYKTERQHVDELITRYAGQVAQYARSWTEITAQEVDYAGIFGVRENILSDDVRTSP